MSVWVKGETSPLCGRSFVIAYSEIALFLGVQALNSKSSAGLRNPDSPGQGGDRARRPPAAAGLLSGPAAWPLPEHRTVPASGLGKWGSFIQPAAFEIREVGGFYLLL